jgi:hypothetical protein
MNDANKMYVSKDYLAECEAKSHAPYAMKDFCQGQDDNTREYSLCFNTSFPVLLVKRSLR